MLTSEQINQVISNLLQLKGAKRMRVTTNQPSQLNLLNF